MAVSAVRRLRLHFLLLHHQCLGGEQHCCDGGSVLKSRARDFDRVDDTGGDQVDVLTGRGVEAMAGRKVGNLGDDDVALLACVLGAPAQRLRG
jgi:hypothetical protein